MQKELLKTKWRGLTTPESNLASCPPFPFWSFSFAFCRSFRFGNIFVFGSYERPEFPIGNARKSHFWLILGQPDRHAAVPFCPCPPWDSELTPPPIRNRYPSRKRWALPMKYGHWYLERPCCPRQMCFSFVERCFAFLLRQCRLLYWSETNQLLRQQELSCRKNKTTSANSFLGDQSFIRASFCFSCEYRLEPLDWMIRMKEYRNRLVSNQRYSELFGVVSVVVSFRLLVKVLCVGDKQTHDSTLSFLWKVRKWNLSFLIQACANR